MKDSIKIVINGREYHSFEEVPPELRGSYSKALEMLREVEQKGPSGFHTGTTTFKSETIEYNGKTYHSREELPAEAREALEKALQSPGDEKNPAVKVTATKVLSEDVRIIGNRGDWERGEPRKTGVGTIVSLVLALMLIVFFLWLVLGSFSHLWHR